MMEPFSDDVKATVHNIKDDITEIKGTLRELNRAVAKIAVQEERMTGMDKRLSIAEDAIKELTAFTRAWHDECIKRQAAKRAAPARDDWWDSKVAGVTYKVFWVVISAIIGLWAGRRFL